MEIYAGKQSDDTGTIGNRVVDSLLSIVNNPLQVEFCLDNFFTSYDLLKSLAEQNVKGIRKYSKNL